VNGPGAAPGWRIALLSLAMLALAATARGDYSGHGAARQLVDELVAQEGLDRDRLRAVLASARRQETVLEKIARPVEKTLPWYAYRDIFLTTERIRRGRAFMQAHAPALQTVTADTGVPATVITAILGVETDYGRVTGGYRVLDALATLAFDYPPRAEFFSRELRHFLLLTQEQGLDPRALTGSYAGAMGLPQFMPSSYRSYARSFDAGGRADIWLRPADAIASIANYLREHGWRAGGGIVVPVEPDAGAAPELFDGALRPAHAPAQLIAAGVRPLDAIPPQEERVSTIRLQSDTGYRHWLGLNNFYVITRYNHSVLYAMVVYDLSRALAVGETGG